MLFYATDNGPSQAAIFYGILNIAVVNILKPFSHWRNRDLQTGLLTPSQRTPLVNEWVVRFEGKSFREEPE